MNIKGVNRDELEGALTVVNEKFGGNVVWNRIDNTNRGFLVTLRVKDSKGPGARRGFSGQRMINACWHVHGTFFDALPKDAVVLVGGGQKIHPGDVWQDRNIGSVVLPLYFSEACDCGK